MIISVHFSFRFFFCWIVHIFFPSFSYSSRNLADREPVRLLAFSAFDRFSPRRRRIITTTKSVRSYPRHQPRPPSPNIRLITSLRHFRTAEWFLDSSGFVPVLFMRPAGTRFFTLPFSGHDTPSQFDHAGLGNTLLQQTEHDQNDAQIYHDWTCRGASRRLAGLGKG
jgi:hypothetical protein